MTSKEIRDFKNPSGHWQYEGGFSVELTENTPVCIFLASLELLIEGDRIIVPSGRIKQSIGAIQFFTEEHPFTIGYKYVKAVRDAEGRLLWVNNHYR